MARQFLLLIFFAFLLAGFTSACSSPQVTSKSFTTKDATIVAHIGFISEFQIRCSSGEISSLYAELEDGSIIPVAIVGPNTYQVSWTEESRSAQKGEHKIRIFDEEGYAALRKALRGNEPTSLVPEFFNVFVNHTGAYSGPWLRSEFVAVLIALLVSYFAVNTKAKIIS